MTTSSSTTTMDKKLDLSRLTDEEAKHVWEVVQRDFDLRKAEDERLGEMKTKLQKEDTKMELLGSQSNLADSHCIRCLQPFKFLVNSKQWCLDCQLYTCKACSRYNTKERGWVCDPCRMARVLKVGALGWYHDNVRSRFKRFGSAKVMRSLCRRLNEEGPRDDDTQSMPDVSRRSSGQYNGHDEDHMDTAEAQRHKQIRKNKRLLSVHLLDLDLGNDLYGAHSHRQSTQEERGGQLNEFDYSTEMYNHQPRHKPCRQSLDRFSRPDDGLYGEHRMARSGSLSKISSAPPQRQQYQDTSEEEDGYRHPMYQLPPQARRRSRRPSVENVVQGQQPPINELNKRMSAIESLLNRLEAKITPPPDQPTVAQLEEEKLRRKLEDLMSDRTLSSDDDVPRGPYQARASPAWGGGAPAAPTLHKAETSSSGDEMPTEPQKRSTAAALCDITSEFLRTINATESAMSNEFPPSKPIDRPQLAGTDIRQADEAYRELEENVYMAAGTSFEMERKLRKLEQSARSRYGGNLTASELSALVEQLNITAAQVQTAESEVSDIENKIAALSATGKKKMNGQLSSNPSKSLH